IAVSYRSGSAIELAADFLADLDALLAAVGTAAFGSRQSICCPLTTLARELAIPPASLPTPCRASFRAAPIPPAARFCFHHEGTAEDSVPLPFAAAPRLARARAWRPSAWPPRAR